MSMWQVLISGSSVLFHISNYHQWVYFTLIQFGFQSKMELWGRIKSPGDRTYIFEAIRIHCFSETRIRDSGVVEYFIKIFSAHLRRRDSSSYASPCVWMMLTDRDEAAVSDWAPFNSLVGLWKNFVLSAICLTSRETLEQIVTVTSKKQISITNTSLSFAGKTAPTL